MSLKSLISEIESRLTDMTEEELQKSLEFLNKNKPILARDDFYMFLCLVAPEIIPPPFKTGKHLFVYANELERIEKAVISGNKEKLQFFLPPGSMKTVTLCLFIAWIFGRHPDWYILHIGHTLEFAQEEFGQKIRDIISLDIYKRIFPETKLSRTTRRKATWKTTKGGVYRCNGAGNPIAGKRAHISICDDVLSEKTAESKLEREKINKWYVPGLRSRLLPTGCEIIVNTRWHLNDLSGFILNLDEKAEQKPWRVIKIPAILEGEIGKKAAKMLGLPENDTFWPEYWPLDVLLEKKATNTPAKWNALYMQNPVPEDGNIFKKHHFQMWNVLEKGGLPKFSYTIISADTAFSKKDSADPSAYGVWGVFANESGDIQGMMQIECGKAHLTYPELVDKITELYYKYKARYVVIEKKASGQSLLQDLVLKGFPVVPYLPDTDKESRANACVPFLEAGLIWLKEGDLATKEFLQELFQFPAGEHDDQVDQFTQAVLWMRDNMQLKTQGHGTIKKNTYDPDDEQERPKERRSYWKATLGRRR